MNPERFRRLIDLVGDALERPEAERAAWLVVQCGADSELLAEARSLLQEETAAPLTGLTGHLLEPVVRAARTIVDHEHSRIGERVGSYRLVGELGHGGMGTVYLAERDDDQYRARVAIKFVRSLLAAPELERRFRAERQILADLNHTNIARLVDGGAAADGTPYIVMEYIDGRPIDVWCEAHGLDIRARVKLFLQVCDAVAYAHRSGVVHRDLKPSNIMVTPDGVPKLVDFGLAKLIGDASDLEQTALLRVMTPSHASPEQIRGGPISFATDVYSLGVVLFELLTGRTPFILERASLGEIERQICTVRPPPPSHAARAHAAQWRREVEGLLDEIILRALEKQPEHRHETVAALADALRRFLSAPPAGRTARLRSRARRLARRPAAMAALGSFVVLAVASGFFARSRLAVGPEPPDSFEFLPAQEALTPFPVPYQVHTADVNGDGRADLIWNHLGRDSNQTRVALSSQDGRLDYKPAFSYPYAPDSSWAAGYELVIGDYSGDGRADLAWYRPNTRQKIVYIAFSDGDGSFRAPEPYTLGEVWNHEWRMQAADANGNRQDDLILTHLQVDNVTRVYRSNGDGTFQEPRIALHMAKYWDRYSMYVADADGNGQPDIIWNDVPGGINRIYAARSLDSLILLPWQDHPVAVQENLPPEQSRWVGFNTHIADINGDRRSDILWIRPDRDPMQIQRALGQATLQFRFLDLQEVPRPAGAVTLVSLTGHLNADGRADLLLRESGPGSSRVWFGLGRADGSFAFQPNPLQHPAAQETGSADGVLIADITGDGRSDIIFYDRTPTSRVYVTVVH